MGLRPYHDWDGQADFLKTATTRLKMCGFKSKGLRLEPLLAQWRASV